MSNTKLKVGDRVRVIDPAFSHLAPVGTEGCVITVNDSQAPYLVVFDTCYKSWCVPTRIELIGEPALSLPKQTLIDLAETSEAAKDILSKEFPDLIPNTIRLELKQVCDEITNTWVIGMPFNGRDYVPINDKYSARLFEEDGHQYIKFTRK